MYVYGAGMEASSLPIYSTATRVLRSYLNPHVNDPENGPNTQLQKIRQRHQGGISFLEVRIVKYGRSNKLIVSYHESSLGKDPLLLCQCYTTHGGDLSLSNRDMYPHMHRATLWEFPPVAQFHSLTVTRIHSHSNLPPSPPLPGAVSQPFSK